MNKMRSLRPGSAAFGAVLVPASGRSTRRILHQK
jgi:hypothetical protein